MITADEDGWDQIGRLIRSWLGDEKYIKFMEYMSHNPNLQNKFFKRPHDFVEKWIDGRVDLPSIG